MKRGNFTLICCWRSCEFIEKTPSKVIDSLHCAWHAAVHKFSKHCCEQMNGQFWWKFDHDNTMCSAHLMFQPANFVYMHQNASSKEKNSARTSLDSAMAHIHTLIGIECPISFCCSSTVQLKNLIELFYIPSNTVRDNWIIRHIVKSCCS